MRGQHAVIGRAPEAFEMSPADAAMLADLAQRYALAYIRAKALQTRSAVAVKHKNVVRREVWDIVRPIADARVDTASCSRDAHADTEYDPRSAQRRGIQQQREALRRVARAGRLHLRRAIRGRGDGAPLPAHQR